jgi:hypothetical protein
MELMLPEIEIGSGVDKGDQAFGMASILAHNLQCVKQ